MAVLGSVFVIMRAVDENKAQPLATQWESCWGCCGMRRLSGEPLSPETNVDFLFSLSDSLHVQA